MRARQAGRPLVAVVDYGMGNLASVVKGVERSGADTRVTAAAKEIRAADAVILPGVGAFRDASERLEQTGLGAVVVERIAAGIPFLGVCLGLHLLFESSGESGRWPGLGVFAGTVERLQTTLKVPHIGWNQLTWMPAGRDMRGDLPEAVAVYFVHSYAALPADASIIAATTDYGGPVIAAVARENIWAVQFHPEKSSRAGLHLLAGFVRRAEREVQCS